MIRGLELDDYNVLGFSGSTFSQFLTLHSQNTIYICVN